MTTSHTIDKGQHDTIGSAVAEFLCGRPETVVSVVPVMQAFFTMCPERYETTRADVILETK